MQNILININNIMNKKKLIYNNLPNLQYMSLITWNIGYEFSTNDTINYINEIINNQNNQIDIYCFQEININITSNFFEVYLPAYYCYSKRYNYDNKKKIFKMNLVTLIKKTKFEFLQIYSENEKTIIKQKPVLHFTLFYTIFIKDKFSGQYFDISNIHLKGGPDGYKIKLDLFKRLINYINECKKDININSNSIIAGDFNIDFSEQIEKMVFNSADVLDYGHNFLGENNYKTFCSDIKTHKRKKTTTLYDYLKYDHIYFSDFDTKLNNIRIINIKNFQEYFEKKNELCVYIFDHCPVLAIFEIKSLN